MTNVFNTIPNLQRIDLRYPHRVRPRIAYPAVDAALLGKARLPDEGLPDIDEVRPEPRPHTYSATVLRGPRRGACGIS